MTALFARTFSSLLKHHTVFRSVALHHHNTMALEECTGLQGATIAQMGALLVSTTFWERNRFTVNRVIWPLLLTRTEFASQ